ncbi:MAG: methyl-accepting chemotaxis protein [Planctomycetota bacterium]|nr:methyl-accepting chemotaxis protein [Planctomycetota bacterium]
MLKRILARKNIFALVALCVLFAWISRLSLSSIRQLQGNARVINYIGIVRGATQRLIKQEMHDRPNDALVRRLDSIVDELISGVGPNRLIALPDPAFQANMSKVRTSWTVLQEEIGRVRAGAGAARLFDLSEDYFTLVDDTVSAAEEYTESQVAASIRALWTANGVFGLALAAGLLYYLSALALKRSAEMLGAIAFTDQLTGLPNRAACDRELERLAEERSAGGSAVFMFDMNNLKRANDILGHGEGDRIIAAFGRCLRDAFAGHGFVGRHGGDEFVAVVRGGDAKLAETIIGRVGDLAAAHNREIDDDLRRISFAAGYSVGTGAGTSPEELLAEADKNMYGQKRRMKEAVLETIMDRVANASKELVRVASAVHGSSQDLAGASDAQRNLFGKFSGVAATLRKHAEDYTSSAEETSAIIGGIRRSAHTGNVDMDLLDQGMRAIADQSKSINAILKTIDSIAFQTNILALNAAVEAARAGRNGKGFGVVAAEVRSLANRSAQSVDTTREVLDRTNKSISGGLELSRSTTEHFHAIETTIKKAEELMDGIAAKAKEQKGYLSIMADDLGRFDSIVGGNSRTAAVNAEAAKTLLGLAKYMGEMLDIGMEIRSGPDGMVDVGRLRLPV